MVAHALLAAGWVTLLTARGFSGGTQHRLVEHADGDPLTLTVLMYSHTNLLWLPAAQAIASDLFEDVGIRLVWIACSPTPDYQGCHRAPAAHEIAVRLVPTRPDRTSPSCGVAVHPEGGIPKYITMFLDCLIEGSSEFRIKESVMAGYCLAHEIAHLLLPEVSHAANGIMQRRLRPIDWERASRGGLRFHPEERRQMADALRSRLSRQDR